MREIIKKADDFLAPRLTEKINNIVKEAVEQMPEEATNIRLIEGYRQDIDYFGMWRCWTEVEAVYCDDDNHEVGRVKTIDKIGGWQYNDPANYILYKMGLYVPYSEENLHTIKTRYESDLNHGTIFPINMIYSDNYLMDLKVKEAIWSTTSVDLTLIFDYESDIYRTGDYRIKLGDFITDALSETDAFSLYTATHTALIENGVEVYNFFNMKEEDKQKLKHWRWDNYNITLS